MSVLVHQMLYYVVIFDRAIRIIKKYVLNGDCLKDVVDCTPKHLASSSVFFIRKEPVRHGPVL